MTMEMTPIPQALTGEFRDMKTKEIVDWFDENTDMHGPDVDSIIMADMFDMNDEDSDAIIIYVSRSNSKLICFQAFGDSEYKKPWMAMSESSVVGEDGTIAICSRQAKDMSETRREAYRPEIDDLLKVVEALKCRKRERETIANQLPLL